MREVKQLSKSSLEDMGHEDNSFEHVIKTEEVDLEPDYIECNSDTEMIGRDCPLISEDIEERSCLALNLDCIEIEMRNNTISQENKANSEISNEVTQEIATSDALQLLSEHEEETDENDRNILVSNNIQFMDASNVKNNLNHEALKLKTKHLSEVKSNRKKVKHIFCNDCTFKCVRKSTLITHIRTHTGEKPFSCDMCEYRSSRKKLLARHLKNHIVLKPISCNLCDYKCRTKSLLTQHMRMHSGVKPFSCKFCDFKCAQNSYLKIHLRTHTGDKPFSCKFCEYKSVRKAHLTEHLRIHTGEKPFSCQFCEYKSARSSDLKKHMNSHSDEKSFSCSFCDYTCATNPQLTSHLIIHNNKKPFKCEFCGTKFKRHASLKDHKAKFH